MIKLLYNVVYLYRYYLIFETFICFLASPYISPISVEYIKNTNLTNPKPSRGRIFASRGSWPSVIATANRILGNQFKRRSVQINLFHEISDTE